MFPTDHYSTAQVQQVTVCDVMVYFANPKIKIIFKLQTSVIASQLEKNISQTQDCKEFYLCNAPFYFTIYSK